MSHARRPFHVAGILGATLLLASGCGGSADAPPVDPNAGLSPVPGETTPGGTVADPNAAPGAVDPLTGEPLAAVDAGATATVPDLVGDDVAGGLAAVSGSTPLFDAQAVETQDLKDEKQETTASSSSSTSSGGSTSTPAEPAKPAVTYSGATIYVDGVTHTVSRNGTFPKGNPVFRLLSVSATDIEIALVAGEFTSSGGDGTFLDKGDMVSLVNATEQITYRVKFLRPITSTSDISF